VASIDRTVISDRLDQVAKDSGAVSANRLRATLAAMFAWAMVEGLAERNPVITTRKREEKSRDRVLTHRAARPRGSNMRLNQRETPRKSVTKEAGADSPGAHNHQIREGLIGFSPAPGIANKAETNPAQAGCGLRNTVVSLNLVRLPGPAAYSLLQAVKIIRLSNTNVLVFELAVRPRS
jgi:hypothetical protein